METITLSLQYCIQVSSQGPTVFKHGAKRSGREMPRRRTGAHHREPRDPRVSERSVLL